MVPHLDPIEDATQEDVILALVNRTIEKAKPFINKQNNRTGLVQKNDKGLWPEYYPGYNKKVGEFEDILVHSMEGIFPERLFAEAAPNQEPHEFEYVKKNYKNTTMPIFVDYISTVSRPWHRSNWNIKYEEDDSQFKDSDNTLQQYLEGEIPLYFSLENFMKNVMPSLKARDAEGVIAVKPKDIPSTENEEGERVISPTELIDPIPVYYSVRQVISKGVDHALVELKDKSIVTEGNQKKKAGFIYEFYDKNKIWKITQVGKRIDYKFVIELFFDHGWDRLPVYKLMGIPHAMDDSVTYQSPFLFAVPNLDLVTIYQSDLQSSIKTCAYPYRIMLGGTCEFTDATGNKCENGHIRFVDDKEIAHDSLCPDCHGAGLVSRISRLGTMLIRPPSSLEGDDDGSLNMDPLKYVSPEVDTLEFTRKEIQEHESRARRILHLNTTNDMAKLKEDVTATAQAINMKALAAFVAPISDQMFFLYENVLDAIGWMRYGDFYNKPSIQFPITFDFSSEQDYVERLSEASKAGVPPIVIQSILMQFIQTIYVNDERQEAVFRLIVSTDRLLAITKDEIALKLSRGTAAPWEDVLHCSAMNLINELVEENKEFFNQEISKQKEQLIAKAKTKVIATETTVEAIVGP